MPDLIPVELRCEHLVDPLGVDRPEPRLTWELTSAGRDQRASGYRVLVASSPEALAADRGDAWDSGRVASAATGARYAGAALPPRAARWWKAQAFDAAGAAGPWSAPARFETGLFAADQWTGRWIARTADTGYEPAPLLRRAFACRGRPTRARLYASGLAYGEWSLNGARVGDAILDPGYTRFDRRALYVAHDVTALLRDGDNVLGAMLGTGWLNVHTLAVWYFERAPWRQAPKLICELHLDYADGRHEVVASDDAWRTATGPITYDSIYGGETYDARLAVPGWDAPGFDDRGWRPAVAVAAPGGALTWQGCPPIRVLERFAPEKVTQPAAGVQVVDLGRNIAGHARLRVRGAKAGDRITLRYGERLDAAGRLTTANTGEHMTKEPPQRFQTDEYVCAGAAEETWEARFTYHGGNLVEVTGWPGAFDAGAIAGVEHATASDEVGRFACSDDLLVKIHDATRRAYRANSQSIPTDCPHREKNGWTGDAHLAAEFGLGTYRSEAFYEKWMDDLFDEQRPTGELPGIVPSSGWGYAWGNGPAWDSAYPLICWYLYRHTGDAWALERHYDRLKRYVDFLGTKAEDGIVAWGLGDWVPWKTQTPVELTSTTYWHVDALIVAEAARLTGRADDERRYRELAARIRRDIRAKFVRADGGVANDSQTALACALYHHLLDDGERPAALAKLVAAIDAADGRIDTGILGAKWLLRALHRAGRDDLAYRIVSTREQPGWGWWIAQGATTLWEDWKGGASLNHIMFGDVSAWMVEALAGIGQADDSAGWNRVIVDPQPVGGLTWAEGEVRTPRGRLSTRWRREGSGFALDLVLPPGEPAIVRLPLSDVVEESGNPLARVAGIRDLGIDSTRDRRVLAVPSGAWRFACR